LVQFLKDTLKRYKENIQSKADRQNKLILVEEIRRIIFLLNKIFLNDFILGKLFTKINISETIEEILSIFKKEKYKEIKSIIYFFYSNIFSLEDQIISVKIFFN